MVHLIPQKCSDHHPSKAESCNNHIYDVDCTLNHWVVVYLPVPQSSQVPWGNFRLCSRILREYNKTRKSVHRTRMPPPNAIQKKGLYVTVTGIP